MEVFGTISRFLSSCFLRILLVFDEYVILKEHKNTRDEESSFSKHFNFTFNMETSIFSQYILAIFH